MRRLALVKLRELRRQGLTYGEIARRYGSGESEASAAGRARDRLSPERILVARRPEVGPGGTEFPDSDLLVFLRALDALDQGFAFFDGSGQRLTTNRALSEMLEDELQGERLQGELQTVADALWRLVRLRGIAGKDSVEELIIQEIPLDPSPLLMKGSYIGIDLFGGGASVLIVLEQLPDDPASPASLRGRFALTPQECRIARHLIDGRSNAEIAAASVLSPHTIRRHTERILRKVGARTRAEAVSKILRD